MLKLLKVMATMASASLISQVLGIFTNKILAVVMGPAGVGMYGLYRQLVDIAGAITPLLLLDAKRRAQLRELVIRARPRRTNRS